METIAAIGILVAAGYVLASDPVHETPTEVTGTLKDYYVQGSTFEDLSGALKKGLRLIELHVYSDEQDQPVVALKPQASGSDIAQESRTFESACVTLLQEAFPNKTPLILSIVSHTQKNFTMNRMAYHLKTTVRKQLMAGPVLDAPLNTLADKLILVSGSEVRGTELEPMLNLSWNEESLRRLTYQQAAHPREPEEIRNFTQKGIVLVAPDEAFSRFKVLDDVYAYGCQWNLCPTPLGRPGFISRG
jgi:hypothetical protein